MKLHPKSFKRPSVSRDRRLFVADIRHCALKALSYTQGLTQEEFVADQKTYDAVIRNLEIIGEAAKHVPADVRDRYSDVPWQSIGAFRDVLSHVYFGIDDDIL